MAKRVLASSALYAPSCFYFYPWKPVLNAKVGDGYDTAYVHFRRDHSDPVNVGLHLLALVLQLVGNFGLLSAIDVALTPILPETITVTLSEPIATRLISVLTAASWVAVLSLQPAPPVCTFASAVAIAGAYVIAPQLPAPEFIDTIAPVVFVVAALLLGLNFARRRGARPVRARDCAKGAAYAFAPSLMRHVAQRVLPSPPHLAFSSATLIAAFALTMVVLGCLRNPVAPCAVVGALGARIVFAATGSPAVLFYGFGHSAQLLQGAAHEISQQQATLLRLEGEEDADRKLRFEWAHCTFFPSLLFQSVHASVFGPSTSTRRAEKKA